MASQPAAPRYGDLFTVNLGVLLDTMASAPIVRGPPVKMLTASTGFSAWIVGAAGRASYQLLVVGARPSSARTA